MDPLPSACAPLSTPLETLSSPGGSQGQCGIRRRVLPDTSATAFETPESGWAKAQEAHGLHPWVAALSSTGGLDPLILSTQPGEAFLSHSGDSTLRAPPGSTLSGSLWHCCFLWPWSPLQGEVGCGTEDGAPLGPPVLFALLQPRLPKVPGRTSPTVGCPRGALSACLGGGLLPPPCLSEETGPRRCRPTPSPPQEPQ